MRAPAAACVRHARLSLLLPRAWHSFVACPLAPTVPRSRGGAASALPPCCRTAFPHPPSPCPPPPPPHPHPHSADPDQNIMRILVPLSNLASWVRGGREQGGRGRHKGGGGASSLVPGTRSGLRPPHLHPSPLSPCSAGHCCLCHPPLAQRRGCRHQASAGCGLCVYRSVCVCVLGGGAGELDSCLPALRAPPRPLSLPPSLPNTHINTLTHLPMQLLWALRHRAR